MIWKGILILKPGMKKTENNNSVVKTGWHIYGNNQKLTNSSWLTATILEIVASCNYLI